MRPLLTVGLGELRAERSPVILVCYGLGSCVGVALSDHTEGIHALAHVVLPDSRMSSKDSHAPAKFADTAIPAALEEMRRLGADPRRIQARIAGGAHILKGMHFMRERQDIGSRNVEAVRKALALHGIPIVGEDVGGSHGRTMQLDVATGKVIISTAGREEKEL